MALAHSKGPWRYEGFEFIIDADEEVIAEAYYAGGRRIANGHLFAASAEMYDAIVAARRLGEGSKSTLALFDYLIAKAEGRLETGPVADNAKRLKLLEEYSDEEIRNMVEYYATCFEEDVRSGRIPPVT